MCSLSCIAFACESLKPDDVHGKSVIEVGSQNVGGSVRGVVEALEPATYLGVDICKGVGVDCVCGVHDLASTFGSNAFDLVISTEMVEHVRDWRSAFLNMKRITKPGGVILLTTRSEGFPFHAYPYDFWRYDCSDMQMIFQDWTIEALLPDPQHPGVFVKARKLDGDQEVDLSGHRLYSIIRNRRCEDISDRDIRRFRIQYGIGQLLPTPLKKFIKHRLLARH